MVAVGLIIVITIIFSRVGSYLLSKIGLKEETPEIEPLEHFVYSTGSGFIVLSGIVFVLGMLGYLYSWCLWGVLLLFGILTFRRIVDLFRKLWQYFSQKSFVSLSFFEKTLIACIALFGIGYFFIALSPPTYGDGIHNLFPTAQTYIRHHRIHFIPYLFALRPRNMVLLYIVGYLFQGDILAQLFNYILILLANILIYTTVKQYGGGNFSGSRVREYALLAVTIFYTMPLIRIVSGNALSEPGVAFYGFLAFCVFLRWWRKLRLRWLALAGIFSGFCAGFKVIGVEILLVIGLFIFFRGWKSRDVFGKRSPIIVLLLSLFIFSIMASGVGLPWYYLTYRWTGTPLYNKNENTNKLLRHYVSENSGNNSNNDSSISSLSQPPSLHSQAQEISENQQQRKIFLYYMRNAIFWLFRFGPIRLTKYAWTMFTSRDFQGHAVSPLYLAFLPLGIFFSFKIKEKFVFILFSIIYFIVGINLWGDYNRYIIPIFPVLSVITVQIIRNIREHNRIVGKFSKIMCIVVVLLYLPAVIHGGINRFPVVFGIVERATYLNQHFPNSFAVAQYANNHLPETARLFLIGETRLFLFERELISGMLFQGRMGLFMQYQDFENPDNAYRKLKLLGITHVIVNQQKSNNTDYRDEKSYIENFKKFYLEELYYDGEVSLYELKNPM